MERVLDGDTVKVEDENGESYSVRLHGVDAPESSQAFGLDSTNLLKRYTIGKTIFLHVTDTDRYRRKVGLLYSRDGELINLKLLEKGMAWHYLKYDKTPSFMKAEATARQKRLGIWSEAKRVAPWDYRNGVRVATASPVNATSTRTTDQTVYITVTGTKYHQSGCRHLKKSKHAIPLSRAKSAYEPCKVCNPPF